MSQCVAPEDGPSLTLLAAILYTAHLAVKHASGASGLAEGADSGNSGDGIGASSGASRVSNSDVGSYCLPHRITMLSAVSMLSAQGLGSCSSSIAEAAQPCGEAGIGAP